MSSLERADNRSTSNLISRRAPLRESNRASTSSMPLVKPEKRRRNEETGESEDETDELPGSSSQKRIRGNGNGRLADSEEEEDQEENEESKPNGRATNAGDTSSHSQSNGGQTRVNHIRSNAGIIVRVKLQRFVTYNAVEFRPGPNLNMIIGPNGTGKSSIVCAIALGLGWKPAVLGRAKDVASYVKHGESDATIELELKSKDDSTRNVILERRIFAKDNRSEWQLNGKRATGAEVQAQVDQFNINVGNLCCFLPQDKVADFARMPPPELLKETQKAAGVEGMTVWHDELIRLGHQRRDVGGRLDKERDEINNLEERNKVLHKDVRRAEERQKIEDDITLLELQIPYARYGRAKERYDDLKIVRNQKKKAFDDLQKKMAPLDNRLRDMEERNADMIKSVKSKQRTIMKDTPAFKKLHETLDEQELRGGKLADQLGSVRKTEVEGRKVQAQLVRKVAELEQAVQDEPPRPNTSEIDARVRAIKDELRRMKADEAEDVAASDDIESEGKRLAHEEDQKRADFVKIDSVNVARLEVLRKSDNDVYKAIIWLRQHQHMFKVPVHEPVLMNLSVNNPLYVSAVEGCISFIQLKTFVCETREDYDTFTREMNDKQGLRLNVAEIEGTEPMSSYRSPMSQAELKKMGFDDFVLNYIEAPEPIKRFLCGIGALHAIPVALQERNVDSEALERSNKFKRYIMGKELFTIQFSNYGSKLPQTMTRTLRAPRTLVHSVDHAAKRSLESRLQQIGVRRNELEASRKVLDDKAKTLRKRVEALRKQQLDLEQQKGAAQKERLAWEKQVINLNSAKDLLAQERSKPTAEQQTKKLTDDLGKVNSQSQQVIERIMALMQQQVRLRSEVDIEFLKQLQYQEKLNTLAALKMEQESQFEEARQARDDANQEFNESKKVALDLRDSAQSIVDAAPDALKERLKQAGQESHPTLEQLEGDLMEEQGKLSLMIEVRPGVMDEYNQRRRKIEEINVIVQKLVKDKERVNAKIQRLEAKWVTALEELVANVSQRFARAFQSIGNAGEVRVARNEDYDKWGIEIMVKFRDNEQLQLLTASRQSGGERSISTITYLLSLTEMSRSPFSLVDEINQGMDQKYERQVHNHMVNVTCREDAGQYFLITPKLLPHLTYHERMKILVINNGEWLPENGFDFGHYIRKRKGPSTAQNGRLTTVSA